jgi:hypothetical protein
MSDFTSRETYMTFIVTASGVALNLSHCHAMVIEDGVNDEAEATHDVVAYAGEKESYLLSSHATFNAAFAALRSYLHGDPA